MNETNDILNELKNQAFECIEVMSRLSGEELGKLAITFGAIKRTRELKDVKALLMVLIIYAVSDFSLKTLPLIGTIVGATFRPISDTAWRKRINKCSAWIGALLHTTFVEYAPVHVTYVKIGGGLRIFLLDATVLKQVGQNGDELRAHVAFDLTTGATSEIVITDNKTAEGVQNFTIQPGCLYIADSAYGKGKQMDYIISKGAFALFRCSPNHISISLDPNGKKKINTAKLLKTRKGIVDRWVYIHTENGKRTHVRIVAGRLPEDKALLARERKIRTSKKNGNEIKEETLIYGEWVIVITNLSNDYSAETVLQLYRSRWQIELLFKRFKQHLKLTRIKKASFEHSKVIFQLQWLFWLAVEKEALMVELALLETIQNKETMALYSPWTIYNLLFNSAMAKINAFWAYCLNSYILLQNFYKHLLNHKDSRCNHYAGFRFGLDGHLPQLAIDHDTPLPVPDDNRNFSSLNAA